MDIHRLYKAAILIDMDNKRIELLSEITRLERINRYRPAKRVSTAFKRAVESWVAFIKYRQLTIQRNMIAATPIAPEHSTGCIIVGENGKKYGSGITKAGELIPFRIK